MKIILAFFILLITQISATAQLTKFKLKYGLGLNLTSVGGGEGGGQNLGLLIAGTKNLNIWSTKYFNFGLEPNINLGVLSSEAEGTTNKPRFSPFLTGDLQAVIRLRYKRVVAGVGIGSGFTYNCNLFDDVYPFGASLRLGYQIKNNLLCESYLAGIGNDGGGMGSLGVKLFKLF